MIPFFDYTRVYSNIAPDILDGVSRVISSGRFINGSCVKKFEDNLMSFTGAPRCVGVSSGTDALTAAIMSSDKKKGVFVCPSFTFVATAMTAVRLGFEVRFVDVEHNSFKPSIESVISSCCVNTVGVIWPHLFGEPTDLSMLSLYCKENNIVLIEDCAQSLGTYVNNDHVGLQGDFGCFSFFPAKNFGAFGDAGAVITKDIEYFKVINKVKSHGYDRKYYSEILGANFRLDTIQASILNSLFPLLEDRLISRKANAYFYDNNLSNHTLVKPKTVQGHSWNQYTMIVDDNEKFTEYMIKNGISTMIYYPFPLHKNPVFDKGEKLPNTEVLCKKVVSLPVYSGLKNNEIEMITEKINEYR